MKLRKGVTAAIACAIAIGLVFAMVGGAFAGKKTVKVSAEMSGQDEVPPTGNGSGTADFKLKKKKKKVCFNISFEGLSSATTAAHIHKGDPGVNGAIKVPLFEGAQTSPVKGCVKSETGSIKADQEDRKEARRLLRQRAHSDQPGRRDPRPAPQGSEQ